ncbi:MAG: zinc-ribbon domain-containing protein [Syntrophorhabdaceae bacterium]|nr:zinc-ribbon domain-containing protein [Syntrophorhabdaceae bacterium]
MVIVIECESCHSRYRLAKALFKKSRAISVRCRKCGGSIVVENPGLKDAEIVSNDIPQPIPILSGKERKPEPVKEPVSTPPAEAKEEKATPPPPPEAKKEEAVLPPPIEAKKEEAKLPPPAEETPPQRVMIDLLNEIDVAVPEMPGVPSSPDASRNMIDLLKEIDIGASDTPDAPPPASDMPRENADLLKEIDEAVPDAPDALFVSDMPRINIDLLKEIDEAVPDAIDALFASDMPRINIDLLKQIEDAVPDTPDAPPASDKPRENVALPKEVDEAVPKKSDVRPASITSRAMADLLKEIDMAASEVPDAPSSVLPEKDIPASVSLPPELSDSEDQDSFSGHDESVNAVLREELDDSSGETASALENMLKIQPSEDSAVPSQLTAKQLAPLPPEPRQRIAPQKILTVPARSKRLQFLNLRFLLILLLWIILLTVATLFFGTNYFERWFLNNESRQPAKVFFRQPVARVAFEVRNLERFGESVSNGRMCFAVAVAVADRSNSVPWVQFGRPLWEKIVTPS